MRITDSIYVQLKPGTKHAIQYLDDIIVDIDRHGHITAIEFITDPTAKQINQLANTFNLTAHDIDIIYDILGR